ncbi:MAG: DUF1501 domain-containing protein [Terriglobales bacterium]
MQPTRRVFLKDGAMALVGTAAIPSFLSRAVYGAQTSTDSRKRLVVIFQRGAADGLNIVVPHGEAAYYQMRPSIAIAQQNVIDLDGFFGLHPSMTAFKPIWEQRHLAIVHAAGSPDPTRSHFDAQDFMESGTPGYKGTDDGWMNRALRVSPASNGARQPVGADQESPFRAVAMGTSLPRILAGSAPAVALNNINDFGVNGRNSSGQPLAGTFEAMYAQSVDSVLHGTGQETFDAVKMLKAADPGRYTPAPGAIYPRGRLGDSLRQLAQLMKADLGVQAAFADLGGWDHHVNEAPQLDNVLREFSQAIAAFWYDLADLGDDTVIVTMSEFGRTARENGNRGTDHGHANCMFVLGGPVRGGRVYGRWPGLAQNQLYEGRDLALTTDFRTVLGEAVTRQLGAPKLNTVFPNFQNSGSLRILG